MAFYFKYLRWKFFLPNALRNLVLKGFNINFKVQDIFVKLGSAIRHNLLKSIRILQLLQNQLKNLLIFRLFRKIRQLLLVFLHQLTNPLQFLINLKNGTVHWFLRYVSRRDGSKILGHQLVQTQVRILWRVVLPWCINIGPPHSVHVLIN